MCFYRRVTLSFFDSLSRQAILEILLTDAPSSANFFDLPEKQATSINCFVVR